MPVIARLDWIARQLDMGRKAHVVVGQAMDPSKLKIKFVPEPPSAGAVSPCTCFGVKAVISWIRHLAQTCVAMAQSVAPHMLVQGECVRDTRKQFHISLPV